MAHEDIHKSIFRAFGYDDIEIKYGTSGLVGETTAKRTNYQSEEQILKANELNSWNEIIGYYFFVAMNLVLLIYFTSFIKNK